jgi:hypothetical protein
MLALTEPTLRQWALLDAEKFVSAVLHGEIAERLKLSTTMVCLYTQMIHGLPLTDQLMAGGTAERTKLRGLFRDMRSVMQGAYEILNGDNPTVPLTCYTPEGFIQFMVNDLRQPLLVVAELLSTILTDSTLARTAMPGSAEHTAGSVAQELQAVIADLLRLMSFAERFAEHSLQRRKPALLQ